MTARERDPFGSLNLPTPQLLHVMKARKGYEGLIAIV
jgi:hypothetical protein